MPDTYYPIDVQKHAGRIFISESKRRYAVDEKARIFNGNEIVSGSRMSLIAGIPEEFYFDAICSISSKHELDEFIRKYGEAPRKGLCLMVSVSQEDFKRHESAGFVTKPIKLIMGECQ